MPTVKSYGVSLMLVAIVVLQLNTRRAAQLTSRILVEEASAHIAVAQPMPLQKEPNQPHERQIITSLPDTAVFLPGNLKDSNASLDSTAFLPKNILKTNTTTCGASKCFYVNKHNESIGYLVTELSLPKRKMVNGKTTWREVHDKAWELARQLQQEYGAKHLYLEPPHNVTVSRTLYKRLNYRLHVIGLKPPRKKYQNRFPKGATVLVQKVMTAPKPNVFLGSMPGKRRVFEHHVKEFIESISEKSRNEFYRNFLKELEGVKDLLGKEPLLANDFQVLLDGNGNMYHIDLERCFDPQKENNGENEYERDIVNTLTALESIRRSVEKALGKAKAS